jgi:hypothetical protein
MAASPPHDDEQRAEERLVTRRAHGIRALLGLAQLPEDLVTRVASAADDVPGSRARTRIASIIRARGRALTVGGLIGGGALVLMLTLVPPATATDQPGRDDDADAVTQAPAGGAGDGAAGAGPPSVEAEAETEAKADEAGGTPAIAGDDAAAAARSLLELRIECFATLDLECLDAVVQPGSAIESTDRARLLAARDGAAPPDDAFDLATVQVTAEMGDAVLIGVTRATPKREPASLLVVRGEAGWRLREIFG